MKAKYGDFSEDGSEFIITRPDTPRPWINYLTNGDYCALCSHTGGGFSFYKDHRFNSVLRRGPQVALEDSPARLVYVKDQETGEVWTVNVHPLEKGADFESRHGMGYTRLRSRYRSIAASLLFFVPPGLDAEMWRLELTNTGRKARRLSVYSFAEFVLGNVTLEELEPTFQALFNESVIGRQHITFTKRWWHPLYGWSEENGNWPYRTFLATTVRPARIMTDRGAFIGPFRNAARPAGLEPRLLPEAMAAGKDLAGVCQWQVRLAPGKSWRVDLAIGIQPNEDTPATRRTILDLQKRETYDAAWQRTAEYWRDLFDGVRIATPDADINRMVNYWNKYQLMVNFHFGRGPSYYHKGQFPAMRDSCQDAFGVMPLDADLAKGNLRRIAHFFFADGQSCGGCNRIGLSEGPSVKVDLPLWFVLAVADYLRETGDFAFLDESIPLMDGGWSTVYEKMMAGINRIIADRGPRGLPLIGSGDWNDAANRIGAGGRGESVWLGQFLCCVIREVAPIMERRGDRQTLAQCRTRADEVRRIVNDQCWDGEWFVRAFKDDGSPVGVKGQKEGFIWINSQTWAVIAGIADAARLNQCLDSVEKHLGTEYGLMNLAPAFTRIDEHIGTITRFRAGWKENAAVFSHASAFNIVARCMLGRGKDAVDLFRRLLPMTKDPDQYQVEPYIYSQFCAGPAAGKDFGCGAYHWLTGTAAWMMRAMVDYIIGVHPELDGLRIQPAVDPKWKQFSIRRRFRGAVYEIEFENPGGRETGIKGIRLDGRPLRGTLLPLPTAKSHKVKVVMG